MDVLNRRREANEQKGLSTFDKREMFGPGINVNITFTYPKTKATPGHVHLVKSTVLSLAPFNNAYCHTLKKFEVQDVALASKRHLNMTLDALKDMLLTSW